MKRPTPFEYDHPHAAQILMWRYTTMKCRFFDARWLHMFSHGGYNNLIHGKF